VETQIAIVRSAPSDPGFVNEHAVAGAVLAIIRSASIRSDEVDSTENALAGTRIAITDRRVDAVIR
jgi:hypothetical protein